MRILLLGAYRFLGRAVIDRALELGHHVTTFNRGNHPPPAGVEPIFGARDDVSALAQGAWDAVIDTSGQTPGQVERSASLLRDRAAHYTFVSTLSVYAWPPPAGVREDAPLPPLRPGADPEDAANMETYGMRKALAEAAAEAAFPHRALLVRAGFIVGPYDLSDRFVSWLDRAQRGEPMLVPDPDSPVQVIDVRDLAAWIIEAAERRIAGAFNVTGPDPAPTMRTLAQTIVEVTASGAELVPVDTGRARALGIEPWTDITYWNEPADRGVMLADITKALAAGLRFRPLAETVRDTYAWSRSSPHQRRIVFDPDKERAAISALRA